MVLFLLSKEKNTEDTPRCFVWQSVVCSYFFSDNHFATA